MLCTSTPDQQLPATASTVQHALGLTCGRFDLNAACSGFVYGLVTAYQFIAGGGVDRVLLIGSETMSRIIDWDERTTAVLFGDGAGAVVLEAVDGEPSLLGWDLGSDGSLRSILDADIGGFMRMEGKEVFRRAVRVMIDSANRTMERAGVTADDIALFVPHQANIRIIESANAKLGFSMDRTAVVPRSHRQHVSGLDPDRARRCRGQRSAEAGRSRADGRLRCGHDVVERDRAVVAMSEASAEPRTVLITGGTRGIGLACARAFAASGDRVAVLSRSTTTDEFPCFACDVADCAARSTTRSARSRPSSARCKWSCPTPASRATRCSPA